MKFTELINPQTAIESFDRRKTIVFQEKKRIYRGQNPNGKAVLRLHIDKGLINSYDKKCDFSVILPPEPANPQYFKLENKNSKKKNGIGIETENDEFDLVTLQKLYSESICFLIETKGRDIATATEQIKNTISVMGNLLGLKKFVGRIVASQCRTQEMNTPQYNELLRYLMSIKSKYDIPYEPLKASSNELEENI